MPFYVERRPHKPVLKFLIVKSVVFLSFWQVCLSGGFYLFDVIHLTHAHTHQQSIGLAVLEKVELIKGSKDGVCFVVLFLCVCFLCPFPPGGFFSSLSRRLTT
jgi:hypothetical protein